MKYVALLSGGKDSCYNLLHCARNGHELVATASLGPEPGKEELDSYLYQTVGQDALELVAQALDVPLYRQIITGSAVEQGSEYGGRSTLNASGITGDETEDLFDLLSKVKSHHPDVQAVSVGAILSNYQRVRVEHVCRRLGLTELAYLWQRDQAELLSEMIEAGMEAILIKVAGIGLTIKHLGKTLAQMQLTLIKLNDLYGSHICGEGGEYETFTLNCPLFKRKIVLDNTETVVHADNDFATVAYLRITSAHLEEKDGYTVPLPDITVPLLLDNHLQELKIHLETGVQSDLNPHTGINGELTTSRLAMPISVAAIGSWVAVSHVEQNAFEEAGVMSIEDEVRLCFEILKERLQRNTLSLHHIASMIVLLSDMSLFPIINAIYATYFGTSPPARACVAVDLPVNIRVRIECIARKDPETRDGLPSRQALHVQGLSYWAPANIGPYSQAILLDERIFVSGQIGLIPANLALPSPPSLAKETALCFQHATRINAAICANSGANWHSHPQAIIYWLNNAEHILSLKKAYDVYKAEREVPSLFVVVKSLPRGALVEKQVLSHTRRVLATEEDDDEPSWSNRPSHELINTVHQAEYDVQWSISGVQGTSAASALICVKGAGSPSAIADVVNILRQDAALISLWTCSLAIRLFHKLSTPVDIAQYFCDALFDQNNRPAVTAIPCRVIESKGSELKWDFALCIIVT